jgi:acetyltransferase-like isoleucine patch superfamily enzyme
MTLHDLAVNTFRAYWLRAYRSGIAYAEVAQRMRLQGDGLWQHESQRDFRHGLLFATAPLVVASAWWVDIALVWTLLVMALLFIARTAVRCAWKAPGQWLLCAQYAVHVHFQKIPALFGQLKWREAARQQTEIALIDYKQDAPATQVRGTSVKGMLVQLLTPLAWCHRVLVGRWQRLWSLARLQEAIGRRVDASNVILGAIEVQGTRNIELGRGALLYPGVVLETQGKGAIVLGDGVVLSRGVHIVAFDRVELGQGCMVGEYSSIRDANHRQGGPDVRHSGHISAPITMGPHVWIGRGATVLMGANIGAHSVVAANAVVTKAVGDHLLVGGVPAKVLRPIVAVPETSAKTLQITPLVGLA